MPAAALRCARRCDEYAQSSTEGRHAEPHAPAPPCFYARTPRCLCVFADRRVVLPAAVVRDARHIGQADERDPPRQSARFSHAFHTRRMERRVAVCLYGPRLQRHSGRLLEFSAYRRAQHGVVDHGWRGERLCAVVLAAARGRAAVWRIADGRLHSGAGDGLSARARARERASVQFAAGYRGDSHHLRHAGDDAAVSQLLRVDSAGAVQGGTY